MAQMRRSNEYGFSSIELMVVVLIIAILVAIAIPTYHGIRDRAHDTAAKESAVLAVRIGLGIAEGEMFEGVATAGLNAAEPSLTFVDGSSPSTSYTVVSNTTPTNDMFIAAVNSTSGTCFMIRHQDAGSDFAKAQVPSCEADDYTVMAFGPSW